MHSLNQRVRNEIVDTDDEGLRSFIDEGIRAASGQIGLVVDDYSIVERWLNLAKSRLPEDEKAGLVIAAAELVWAQEMIGVAGLTGACPNHSHFVPLRMLSLQRLIRRIAPNLAEAEIHRGAAVTALQALAAAALLEERHQKDLVEKIRTNEIVKMPQQRIGLGVRYRYPYYLIRNKIDDIRSVGNSDNALLAVLERMLYALSPSRSELSIHLELHGMVDELDECCLLAVPDRYWDLVESIARQAPWRVLDDDLVQTFRQISDPGESREHYERSDFILAGRRLLVLSQGGVLDQLLLFACRSVKEKVTSRWQESELRQILSETFKGRFRKGKVHSNLEWRDSLTPRQSHARHVDGEIDVFVHCDVVFVSAQAKAPFAKRATARAHHIEVDALEQHARLQSSLPNQVQLLQRGRDTLVKKLPRDAQIVPLSVGLEPITQFAVGVEPADGLPRVVNTTIDHMRIVVGMVPEVWRPVYWLDRWIAQGSGFRFVDENAFLDLWVGKLGNDRRVFTVMGDFVMSQESYVEKWTIMSNIFSYAEIVDPGVDLSGARKLELAASQKILTTIRPSRYWRVDRLVKEISRYDGWIVVLSFIRTLDLDALEGRLAGSESFLLRAPWGVIEVVPRGGTCLTRTVPISAGVRHVQICFQDGKWVLVGASDFKLSELESTAARIVGDVQRREGIWSGSDPDGP
ncbi:MULTISPECIES: hypothetical protein [unclassified Micrococcus]|uniref:hypothetical protein n=1 Tax=unclassified Micrococcus TaxID=2620948 RepID=UPI000B074493|nr:MULTISPECIES: hypothetical protein [unclassified Micrococcus]